VQGSSSLQNITASAVSIGTNTVVLNTATPILRFGGVSVQDSGSANGRSGSLFWDSLNDHWIYVVPSGSTEGYNSAMLMNGPKNTGSLGSEAGLTTNYIPVSQGEDHIADSIIFQSASVNIGIGTSTPTAKLDVSGTGKFSGSLTIGSTTDYVVLNTGNLYRTSGSGYGSVNITGRNVSLQYDDLSTGAVTGLIIQSGSGNVGIGTTNPSALLDVFGSGGIRVKRTEGSSFITIDKGSGAGASSQIYFVDQGTSKWDIGAFYIGAAGANDFSLYNRSGSGSNPVTVLYSNNNVGIGTVTPGAKFEVWQSANNRLLVNYVNISNEPQISSLDSSNNPQYLTISSYDLKLKTNGTTALTLSSTQTATFASTVTATGAVRSIHGGVDATFVDAFIGVYSGNNNEQNAIQTSVSSVAASSGFRFQASNGGGSTGRTNVVDFRRDRALFYTNVGIGTTNPTQKLEVWDNSGDTILKIKSASATAAAKLLINPEGAGAGSTGDGSIFFDMNSTAWLAGVDKSDSSKFKISNDVYGDFSTNNYFTITTAGRVGIGTVSPTKLLEVNGRMSTTAIVSGNIIAGNIYSNISSSPSFILIVDLNNAAGFSMSGKSNAASYTCWNISDFWIKKDYSSTTAAAGITGAYKSGCDFSIVDINYGSSRYIALRFTGNPEIDLMCTGYRLNSMFQSDGTATVVTADYVVNSTLASY
jgi:hypothetical protein